MIACQGVLKKRSHLQPIFRAEWKLGLPPAESPATGGALLLREALRVFAEFRYRTRKCWSWARPVVTKAKFLDKDENPPFVVTSFQGRRHRSA